MVALMASSAEEEEDAIDRAVKGRRAVAGAKQATMAFAAMGVRPGGDGDEQGEGAHRGWKGCLGSCGGEGEENFLDFVRRQK